MAEPEKTEPPPPVSAVAILAHRISAWLINALVATLPLYGQFRHGRPEYVHVWLCPPNPFGRRLQFALVSVAMSQTQYLSSWARTHRRSQALSAAL